MNYYDGMVKDFMSKDGAQSILNGRLGPFNFVIGKDDDNSKSCYISIPAYASIDLFGCDSFNDVKGQTILDKFNEIMANDGVEITEVTSTPNNTNDTYTNWIGWKYDNDYICIEKYISDVVTAIEALMLVC